MQHPGIQKKLGAAQAELDDYEEFVNKVAYAGYSLTTVVSTTGQILHEPEDKYQSQMNERLVRNLEQHIVMISGLARAVVHLKGAVDLMAEEVARPAKR